MNIATKGTTKAPILELNFDPPNNAIDAIGVKLGKCGITLVSAAISISEEIAIKRGLNVFMTFLFELQN